MEVAVEVTAIGAVTDNDETLVDGPLEPDGTSGAAGGAVGSSDRRGFVPHCNFMGLVLLQSC